MREITAGIICSIFAAMGIYPLGGFRWSILAAIGGFIFGVVMYLRGMRD